VLSVLDGSLGLNPELSAWPCNFFDIDFIALNFNIRLWGLGLY